MASEEPPNYTVDDRRAESSVSAPPQIMITPLANAIGFQTGNLGADGEPAAIEGEVQLKGFNADAWDRALITFRTTESTPTQKVELASFDLILWSRIQVAPPGTLALPSSIPFSIPLLPDVPQSINTPTSSLTHTLTATLHPVDPSAQVVTKAIPIQVRRFTHPWAPALHPSPCLLSIDTPVPFTAQLPRSAFRAGEMIPLYLSVPPPSRSVLESGIQLRNVTAELVRLVEIGPFTEAPPSPSDLAGGSSMGFGSLQRAGPSNSSPRQEKAPVEEPQPTAVASPTKPTSGNVHETVVTRSGASCRMNPNRTVQLRLVLHSSTQSDLDMENEAVPPDVDTAAGSITQSTVLHHVSFYVQIHVTFLSQANHTSKSVHGMMPVIIVPALAQQPLDAQAELEENYIKKHDRPPTRTLRSVDDGTPQPPAFDDPADGLRTPGVGASPPPFTAEPIGTELPSFTESQAAASGSRTQSNAAMPASTTFGVLQPERQQDESGELRFDGEGVAFGFRPEEQYDGLSHSMMMPARSNTPPPAIASSVHDANVTELAELITHERRSLDHAVAGGPPPPPALDDPMDLPPTIDEGFRSIESPSYAPISAQADHGLAPPAAPTPVVPTAGADSHPPPYLGAPGTASTAPPAYLDSQ
ncbi:hypothetical protein FRB95_006202 [Tulasnella sp. JGI-2019a]|nr:hypothetical protein FRB95_006202 [Tulasnella sp. JGI-2019a]